MPITAVTLLVTLLAAPAAPVAAGAVKPTSTYTVERIEEPVRTIAHVTEALDRNLLAGPDLARNVGMHGGEPLWQLTF